MPSTSTACGALHRRGLRGNPPSSVLDCPPPPFPLRPLLGAFDRLPSRAVLKRDQEIGTMSNDSRDVLARVEAEKQVYLDELEDFLRIPSISTDPDYTSDVWRASEFVLDKLRAAGLTAERIETAGHPLVYGEWLGAPGKPTVLFYGHYDVQPVDPVELWRHPPFEPT